jgi:hypothetical protein
MQINWRDQQLTGLNLSSNFSVLEQEQVMISFVQQFPNVVWRWLGDDTAFKNICKKIIKIDDENYNGVIIFGKELESMTTSTLKSKILDLTSDTEYAYVSINRYFITKNDLDLELPDEIDDSLDVIMNHINKKFKRLHKFPTVTGHQMVAAHPMDCYGLCS